jgi:hypothetical protein
MEPYHEGDASSVQPPRFKSQSHQPPLADGYVQRSRRLRGLLAALRERQQRAKPPRAAPVTYGKSGQEEAGSR